MINQNIGQLKESVAIATSWKSLCRILNITYGAGNIAKLKRSCITNEIDYSHFNTLRESTGRENKDINIFLSNQQPITSFRLKNLLFHNKLKECKCEKCNQSDWFGDPIPLELHHKDGNNKNNNLDNLEILCSNCHALTTNFRAANKKEGKVRKYISDEQLIEAVEDSYTRREALLKVGMVGYGGNYERINRVIQKYNLQFKKNEIQAKKEQEIEDIRKRFEENGETYQLSGNPNWRHEPKFFQRKVERPSKELLEQLIKERSLRQIGQDYGVTDNSVRKWCVLYNIELPNYPKGYWRRRATGMTHEEALNPPPKQEKPKSRQLTLEQVAIIKKRLLNGEGIKDLSEEYQFSYECIKDIKYQRTYRTVEPAP